MSPPARLRVRFYALLTPGLRGPVLPMFGRGPFVRLWSIFKYIRDCLLVFSEILHEVRGQ